MGTVEKVWQVTLSARDMALIDSALLSAADHWKYLSVVHDPDLDDMAAEALALSHRLYDGAVLGERVTTP